jgi:hypothetical protein
VCVLGAGWCNDVDLERLALAFSEIHLVDLDSSTLALDRSHGPHLLRLRVAHFASRRVSGCARGGARSPVGVAAFSEPKQARSPASCCPVSSAHCSSARARVPSDLGGVRAGRLVCSHFVISK